MSETLAAEAQEGVSEVETTEVETEESSGTESKEAETEQVSEEDIKRLASQRGWMPKKYFKGDPDNWVGPEEYLEKAENEMPLLKATLRKIERENKELKGLMKRVVESTSAQAERAVKEAISQLEAKRDEAIQNADTEGVKRIDRQIKEVEQSAPKKNGHDTDAAQQQQPDPEAVEWMNKNPWFKSDAKMRAYSYGVWEEIEMDPENSEKSTSEKLRLVTKEVKSRFPEKFSNPRRREPSAVEGGTGAVKLKGKSYDDLPAEAKAICDDLVRQKILSKADYVKNYQW